MEKSVFGSALAGMSVSERVRMRQAFYAGAVCMFTMMLSEEMDEDLIVREIAAFYDELGKAA